MKYIGLHITKSICSVILHKDNGKCKYYYTCIRPPSNIEKNRTASKVAQIEILYQFWGFLVVGFLLRINRF